MSRSDARRHAGRWLSGYRAVAALAVGIAALGLSIAAANAEQLSEITWQ